MTDRRNWTALALLMVATTAWGSEAPARFQAAADAILRQSVDPRGPGVAVVVGRGDQILYRSSRGLGDVELGAPIRPDDVFRIGSITKTVTAATVLRLAEQGRLSLQDPLSRFLPEFPNGSRITLAELLDHTSGISDAWESSPCEKLAPAEEAQRIARVPPDFAPGAGWRYSNSGYLLLGAVIEKVTGTSWDRAEQRWVLAPLGLSHTAYHPDEAVVPRAVQGYSADEAGRLSRPAFVTLSGPQAAGGLSSTAGDVFRLLRGLASGRLLSSDGFVQMTSARHTSDGTPVPYGYGVMLETLRGEPILTHNGGIEGFASQYVYLPREQISVVVLANSDSGLPNPRGIARRLAALAVGRPYRTFQDIRLDAKALEALAGTYRIGAGSAHVLSVHDGRLFVRRDEGPARRLAPAAGDLLYFEGDGTDYFRIERDAKGQVSALGFYPDGMPPARREPREPVAGRGTNGGRTGP